MHHSLSPYPPKLRAGDRFIAEFRGRSMTPGEKDLRILTLASLEGDEMRIVDESGKRYVAHTTANGGQDEDGNKWWFFWTLPLPDTEDERTLAFCAAVAREGSWHKEPPIVLIGETRPDGMIAGSLVFLPRFDNLAHGDTGDGLVYPVVPDEFKSSPVSGVDGPWKLDADLVLEPDLLPKEVSKGDLVCGTSLSCRYEKGIPAEKPEGTLVTVIETPKIAARGVSMDQLHLFIRGREQGEGGVHLSWNGKDVPAYVDDVTFAQEVDIAYARTEPDEALVACSMNRRRVECHVLAHMGINFFWADQGGSVNDYLYNAGEAPGLWVFENARMWAYTSYEGEHDSGIDGDWRPATMEDVERFGFTRESLNDELADLLDGGIPDGIEDDAIVDEWMRLSAAYVEREQDKTTPVPV